MYSRDIKSSEIEPLRVIFYVQCVHVTPNFMFFYKPKIQMSLEYL